MSIFRLKYTLDKLYATYDFDKRIHYDPIEFPHQYKRPEDIEISAFLSASFAYGKVELFKEVIKKILSIMGRRPYEFLLSFDINRDKRLFAGLKYRFNEEDDIVCLIYVVSEIIKKNKSLKSLFELFFSPEDEDIGKGLKGFIDSFLSIDTSAVYGKDIRPMGYLQFFPSLEKRSACKRMNLFLRWMVRDKDIDFGLWNTIKKNKLIIPLDAHIARISKCLGLTKRSTKDWKMAKEITESLKRFDPEDPLKYDFALCHQGIAKVCEKRKCHNCPLLILD
jgi:uncharacterized protein (TIGR02757 family)